jgi:hypothetical protein
MQLSRCVRQHFLTTKHDLANIRENNLFDANLLPWVVATHTILNRDLTATQRGSAHDARTSDKSSWAPLHATPMSTQQ